MRQFTYLLLFCTASAHAALFDRGSGLIYDDVLNVTWLQDANYAETSGYIASVMLVDQGFWYWDDAKTWVDNLVYHDTVRGVDLSDWRLPKIRPINGSSFVDIFSYNGSTDWGYNIDSTQSELAHMHSVNLSNIAAYDKSGNFDSTKQYIENSGPFSNLSQIAYWSDASFDNLGNYRVFSFGNGAQSFSSLWNNYGIAWAVRDGDVAAVPEPSTFAQFLLGALVIVLLINQTRRSQ